MGIMTPDHPKWREFAKILEGPEGCNFQEKEPGNPKSITWECSGGRNNWPLASAILKKMPGIDVAASLDYFDKHGGHCDCDILFILDRSEDYVKEFDGIITLTIKKRYAQWTENFTPPTAEYDPPN